MMNCFVAAVTTTFACVTMLLSGPAPAATATTTFQVQITILDECQITSTNDLNFGAHGVLSANIDVSTTFNVQCTLDTPYSIGLDAGAGAGASIAARKMTGPGSATRS